LQYVFLGVVLSGMAVGAIRTWLIYRRTVPLRLEAMGQEITFRLRLDRVKVYGSGWTDLKGATALIVRADTFEVSAITVPCRAFFGMEYYFRARDTTIEMGELPLVSFILKKTWIIVRGLHGNRRIELALNSENYLYDAWVALVRAGAVPVGPPPAIPLSEPPARGGADRSGSGWLLGFGPETEELTSYYSCGMRSSAHLRG